MFYVYERDFYPVYEPAEGGYYVCCSEISECIMCSTMEESLDRLRKLNEEAVSEGHELSSYSEDFGMFNIGTEENPKTIFKSPWYHYDYNGYVGDGFELGISLEKPKDKPYNGYC